MGKLNLQGNPSIKYVPLQLSNYHKHTAAPNSGHQHTRKEIQNLFKKDFMGDILPEDFFEKSLEFVKESNGYKTALFAGAQEYYLNKHGNVVGVIGQAGVGKTTLSKIILKRILDKEKNLYNADYIFYVKLREFQIQNITKYSLLDFLFLNITPKWKKTIGNPESFLNHLFHSDSVVIILDGFDEIYDTQFKGHLNLKFDMHGENLPLNFTMALLSGEILPKAKKIVTSRPRQLLDLSLYLNPFFLVSIDGINPEGQEQICEMICKTHERTKEIWNYVQDQPELNPYCYVPIIAIFIFHTVYQCRFHRQDQQTPTSITQILVYNLYQFIRSDHVRDRDQTKIKLKSLPKLSKLAYDGVVHEKLYFSDDDFQAVNLNENDISTFFTTFYADDKSNEMFIIDSITKKLSYFSHLIWQEFFAAIHMIFTFNTYSNLNQIDLSSSRFEVVIKFLFGLCNECTVSILRNISINFLSINHDASFLKEHLYSHLENRNKFFDTKHIFRVATLLYELKNENLTREFSNLLPSVLSIDGDIFPNDVLPLCELIQPRQLDLEIHLSDPSFFKNSHLLFFKEMESIVAKSPHIKVEIEIFYFYCF